MKRIKKIFYISLVSVLICTIGCANMGSVSEKNNSTLSSHFKGLFHLGAAINEETILGKDSKSVSIVKSEFNSITPENSLKWMYIQPKANQFEFKVADRFVQLGLENDMYIVGHALVWHNQLADFMQTINDSDQIQGYIANHINTVVSRYKGKIDAWDVVNEAFDEDGSLRKSVFYNNLGEDYIENIFKLAEKADPQADLIYNDYNFYKPKKRAGILKMVKKFKSKGVKIDGVGVQAHWDLKSPSIDQIEQIILDVHATGVPVSFTELDISVLPNPWEMVGAEVTQNFSQFEGDSKMSPYPNELPKKVQKQLAKRYQDIFKLFVKHSDKINRVTFWGVMDKHSWLNDWPINGRTNYPLLFDRNYNPKPAYKRVLEVNTNPKN
ncbi:MAG: endo-1,4-beta-xylanase [Flavobacteriaceae bacterium]|jgi:endo-1,4-beta-xylanase|nr:endo-1,4-beta-xylanase [Flavobacteriaceae bacterium]